MKKVTSLKYVLTAAAVCILCFSGNVEYIYAACTLTPENDIVEQPDEIQDTYIKLNKTNKKERLRRLVKKYSLSKPENIKLSELKAYCFPVFDNKINFIHDNENIKLCQIFASGIPGNRSP